MRAAITSVRSILWRADYKSLRDVPLDSYDAVLACIPDEPKLELVRYCIGNGKHVLVEKPLWTPRDEDISEQERAARARGVLVYTAYNHRFEPHFVRMRDLISSGGAWCDLLAAACSTGTERLGWSAIPSGAIREVGVIPDLGSHLLDTCRFWFGDVGNDARAGSAQANSKIVRPTTPSSSQTAGGRASNSK